jgi:hypothetical protein
MSEPQFPKPKEQQDELKYWRLCEELSIAQAALLIEGHIPNRRSGLVTLPAFMEPKGYPALVTALTDSLRSGRIKGTIEPSQTMDENGEFIVNDDAISPTSRVNVESLKKWLVSRNCKPAFFFPDKSDGPDYLDPNNICYAPKLAAAVSAWLAINDSTLERPKQALEKWLYKNAENFKRSGKEDTLTKAAIKEAAKVANWKPSGGAPKTPTGKK